MRGYDDPSSQLDPTTPSKALNVGLWGVQVLLALIFVGTGIWKLATPIDELAAMIPWAGQTSPNLLYVTAVFDILGGVGVLLPSVTRVAPKLTLLAALGCGALQASAVVFHVARGEGASTPFNLLLIGLSLLVLWGRGSKVPIATRP